jgi:hypothetical protein
MIQHWPSTPHQANCSRPGEFVLPGRNHHRVHELLEAGAAGTRHVKIQPTTLETDMAVKTLEDLFHETLKDIYYAEKKLALTLTA